MNLRDEIKTTAIIGTAQKEPAFAAVSGSLGETLAKLDRADREKYLLSTAAVNSIWENAGKVLPVDKNNLPEVCEPETLAILSGNLKQIYESLLNSSDKSLLPEFLELMKQHGKITPPELLPLTFALAISSLHSHGQDFQRQIIAVAGNRGKWLARQNPRWRWVLVEELSEEMFETGKAEERIFALEYLINADAKKTRELLLKNWKSELAVDRQKFLEVLRTNINDSDEIFLNEILRNDKSAEVRQTAYDLLASLPNSNLVADSTAQIQKIIDFQKGGILSKSKLEVKFPEGFDRDEFRYFPYSKTKTDLGRKGWKLTKILAAASLEEIEKVYSVTAFEFVSAVKSNPWTLEIFLGLSEAAVSQKNSDWFEALLKGFGEKENAVVFDGKYRSRNDFIENLRQSATQLTNEKAEVLAKHFLLKNEPLHNDHAALYFLQNFQGKWSKDLSENFLASLKERFLVRTKRKTNERVWNLLNLLPQIATNINFRTGEKNIFESKENYQPEALKQLSKFEETIKLRCQLNNAFKVEE